MWFSMSGMLSDRMICGSTTSSGDEIAEAADAAGQERHEILGLQIRLVDDHGVHFPAAAGLLDALVADRAELELDVEHVDRAAVARHCPRGAGSCGSCG
jgi:hypothetical protein